MKIAFLIFNHRSPTQLVRLVRALRRQLPDSPLVVHHDSFRVEVDAALLSPFGDAHLMTSDEPIQWGDFSLVEATWRSLRWMTASLEFDWIVILSGQDYPIKPLGGLKEALARARADVLLRAAPIGDLPTAAQRRNMRRRYLYQYHPARELWQPGSGAARLWAHMRNGAALPVDVLNNVQPYFSVYRFPDHMPWRLGRRSRLSPFTADQPCWFGSTWFSLSRKAAEYIGHFTGDNPRFSDYYRRTINPDESATATILCNAPGIRVETRSLHYIRWSRPKTGHPDVLGVPDLDNILSSSAYFARKFDIAIDSQVLDELDSRLVLAT
jgi:hypothetical protein